MADDQRQTRVPADLAGVPETALWNLYQRARAARGSALRLDDPKAVELVERIDYPFERFERTADPSGYASQWHASRARGFDREVRRFLTLHPEGTVVALGDGLETQFYRVDNGRMRWVTVDLPEMVTLRRQLLDEPPRQRLVACSALDKAWTAEVDPSHGVLISAQGLLMYFTSDEVDRLVDICARCFPGWTLLFDAVPVWMLARHGRWTDRNLDGYQPPAWVWGIDPAEHGRLAALPGVAELTVLPPERGTGLLFGVLFPGLQKVPALRYRLPVFPILRAAFGAST